jgi:transposase
MKQTSGPTKKAPAEAVLKDIRRATRRQFSAEEKIRIVLEGLRGEESIAELCRREGIASSMYYGWSKEFLEAGKRRLAGGLPQSGGPGSVLVHDGLGRYGGGGRRSGSGWRSRPLEDLRGGRSIAQG